MCRFTLTNVWSSHMWSTTVDSKCVSQSQAAVGPTQRWHWGTGVTHWTLTWKHKPSISSFSRAETNLGGCMNALSLGAVQLVGTRCLCCNIWLQLSAAVQWHHSYRSISAWEDKAAFREKGDYVTNMCDWYCRKKYLELPDAEQTSSNKEKINSDIRPGETALTHCMKAFISFYLTQLSGDTFIEFGTM